MKHRESILMLVTLVVIFALLSLWMPLYVLLILLFLIVGSSPLGRHPWQFIKRKIQNYRIVADYERQRKAPRTSSPSPSYTQGYTGPTPDPLPPYRVPQPQSDPQPKAEHPSNYDEQAQAMYPEQQ
jgi:hypothetical protein